MQFKNGVKEGMYERQALVEIRRFLAKDPMEIIERFKQNLLLEEWKHSVASFIFTGMPQQKYSSWISRLHDQLFSYYVLINRSRHISSQEKGFLKDRIEELGIYLNMERDACDGCGNPIADINCDCCKQHMRDVVTEKNFGNMSVGEIMSLAERTRKMSAGFEFSYEYYSLLDSAIESLVRKEA